MCLLEEHARGRDQVLALLHTYFNSQGSQRRSSAFKKAIAYKAFSFPVLCMYEDVVLQKAKLKNDAEPATIIFALSAKDLDLDWYVSICNNCAGFFVPLDMTGQQ
jgi:hypothetical protein